MSMDVTALMNQVLPLLNLVLAIMLLVTLIKELKGVFS